MKKKKFIENVKNLNSNKNYGIYLKTLCILRMARFISKKVCFQNTENLSYITRRTISENFLHVYTFKSFQMDNMNKFEYAAK